VTTGCQDEGTVVFMGALSTPGFEQLTRNLDLKFRYG
jgi:hypothetical protein